MSNKEYLSPEEAAKETEAIRSRYLHRVEADPQRLEQGLAKLVLTVVELIRRLLEKQAMLRIERESLSEEEIEKLGLTFMKLAEKMQELKSVFGLQDEDLNIDLGPLGKLL
jgi:Gas vesicle protein K